MTPPYRKPRSQAARATGVALAVLLVVISVLILVAMAAGLVAFIRWTL